MDYLIGFIAGVVLALVAVRLRGSQPKEVAQALRLQDAAGPARHISEQNGQARTRRLLEMAAGTPFQHAALVAMLDQAAPPAAVVRRYRLEASPLIRDVASGWRTGRADWVMNGQFDLLADVLPRE